MFLIGRRDLENYWLALSFFFLSIGQLTRQPISQSSYCSLGSRLLDRPILWKMSNEGYLQTHRSHESRSVEKKRNWKQKTRMQSRGTNTIVKIDGEKSKVVENVGENLIWRFWNGFEEFGENSSYHHSTFNFF